MLTSGRNLILELMTCVSQMFVSFVAILGYPEALRTVQVQFYNFIRVNERLMFLEGLPMFIW